MAAAAPPATQAGPTQCAPPTCTTSCDPPQPPSPPTYPPSTGALGSVNIQGGDCALFFKSSSVEYAFDPVIPLSYWEVAPPPLELVASPPGVAAAWPRVLESHQFSDGRKDPFLAYVSPESSAWKSLAHVNVSSWLYNAGWQRCDTASWIGALSWQPVEVGEVSLPPGSMITVIMETRVTIWPVEPHPYWEFKGPWTPKAMDIRTELIGPP